MKHTQHIRLVLIGAISSLALAACDDKPQDGQAIYETVEQCENAGGSNCTDRYVRALSNHVASGPRYSSWEACMERGHERCQNVNTGSGNIWLPMMVGFMISRAIDNSRPVYLQGYPNPANEREQQDRRVVAGGASPAFIGSYHGGNAPYVAGNLGSGMSAGATRAGVSSVAPVPGRGAIAAPSAAARGGFGGSGSGAAGA